MTRTLNILCGLALGALMAAAIVETPFRWALALVLETAWF